ncbi:MAG: magnesium/cobalt transporter CorA [Acidobacteria bacterium]|nr:magnesium/cobalt transporter CorA [Acidobacteriota bacterium]
MLKTLVLDTQTKKLTMVSDPDRISELCGEPHKIVWVDVNDPTGDDFAELAKEFNFHPLAIEDCRLAHQRPKIEEYSNCYFIVLYEAELNADSELELRELNLFLGKNFLVTAHSRPIHAVAEAEKLWLSWADGNEQPTALLAYLLIDRIVDEYMILLDTLSDRIDELEDRIFGDFQPASLQEVFRIKKQLLYLRRSITPLRDVFNKLLRRELPIFTRETLIYWQDVYDSLNRVAEMIDTLRDMLASTVDAYMSVSGHRMNVTMRWLTAVSTILMSVTLLAGVYGMNFNYMPELGWRYGYVAVLLAMLGLALALYFYFRKIKWL